MRYEHALLRREAEFSNLLRDLRHLSVLGPAAADPSRPPLPVEPSGQRPEGVLCAGPRRQTAALRGPF